VTAPGQNLLSVHDLVVRFPARGGPHRTLTAVRGVSLEIPSAGIYGLVGESGCGKTSLAHAIVQLKRPDAGQVLFHGQDLTTMKPASLNKVRSKVQLIFQDSLAALSPRRSVLQTLVEPLDHFRMGRSGDRASRAVAALEAVGLDPAVQHRYPSELSGGQRQRVALARALVTEPELIVADEALSSLDVPVRSRIIELILELRAKRGIAFLFISHDLSVIRHLADIAGVMYAGKIVESGPAEAVFRRPGHPYTRALLAAVPIADPNHARPAVLVGEPPSPLTPPSGCVFHMRCPDKLPHCSSVEPVETGIPDPRAFNTERWDVKTNSHRVRCHLWNATES